MMKKLFKQNLDYEKTFTFVYNSLENASTLSSELLKHVNFLEGHFFTLLPEDANLERLYEFKEGVILPQNPLIKHENSNCFYSITPNIDNELSELIHQKVYSNKNLKGVFDDVIRNVQDFMQQSMLKTNPEDLILNSITRFLNQELYYVVDINNSSGRIMYRCLRKSNAFWHSLGLLATIEFEDPQRRELSLEEIKEMCATVELVIVGAYDGEGYIFWEKQNGFFP